MDKSRQVLGFGRSRESCLVREGGSSLWSVLFSCLFLLLSVDGDAWSQKEEQAESMRGAL